MVRITGKGGVLDAGGDQKSPPLPFLEVDENTALALIGTGLAVLVGDDAALAAEWAEAETEARESAQAELVAHVAAEAVPVVEPVVEPEAVAAPALPEPFVPEAVASPARAEPVVPEAVAQVDADERRQTIADALDLLEPEHLVASGPRKGRPKLSAVEDISGIRDLTVAEIDAVLAAKAAE